MDFAGRPATFHIISRSSATLYWYAMSLRFAVTDEPSSQHPPSWAELKRLRCAPVAPRRQPTRGCALRVDIGPAASDQTSVGTIQLVLVLMMAVAPEPQTQGP